MLTLLINEDKPLTGLFASTSPSIGGIGSVPTISKADQGQSVSVKTFQRVAGVITDSFVAGDVLHIGIGDGISAPVCYISLSSASPATGTMPINTDGMVALFAATPANQLSLALGIARTRSGETNTIFSAPIVIHRSVIDPLTAVPTPSILGTGVAAALLAAVNSANGIAVFDAAGKYPARDGSNITNLPSSSSTLTYNSTATSGFTAGDIILSGAGNVLAKLTLGSNVATFLATPSGANLASALTTALPSTKGGTGLTALGTGVSTALGNAVNGTGGLVTFSGNIGAALAISLNGSTIQLPAAAALSSVGYGSALGNTTTGANNVAIGFASLIVNTSGSDNVAVGFQALTSNSTGEGNTAIGSGALVSNMTGEDNVALGEFAGGNSDADGGVYLGYYAGYWNTLGNRLFIDDRDRTDEATERLRALVYGGFADLPANQFITFNVGTFTISGTNVITLKDYAITAAGNASVSGTNTGDQTNISGNAGTVTNGVYTTDTGTVTNTMLAGSIANDKLANTAVANLSGTNTGDQTLPSAANPANSVGLTAVDGLAATFMRSDAAPALDQSIAPTWTGVHNFSNTTSASSSTVGAVTIGNGTALTNVAIGGGHVYAGGTGTFLNVVAGATGLDNNGVVRGTYFADSANSVAYCNTATSIDHAWTLTTRSASKVPLSLQGASGQTANLFELGVNGSLLVNFTAAGGLVATSDVEITDTTKGVILKAPNGSRWRITVDNSGVLSTTSI